MHTELVYHTHGDLFTAMDDTISLANSKRPTLDSQINAGHATELYAIMKLAIQGVP